MNPAFPNRNHLGPRARLIALVEIAVGSAVVIGHNVYRILPNEVPILFGLFWVSLRWHSGQWRAPQFDRPKSWVVTTLLALAAFAALEVGNEYIVDPLAHSLWPRPEHLSSLLRVRPGDGKAALRLLAIVWAFAAFGEEIGYRGYLLTRAAELGPRSRWTSFVALLYVAVLFGFGHYYKGSAGVLESTYSGLILGGLYLLTGRNLWAPILAHGLRDTLAVVIVFAGWAT